MNKPLKKCADENTPPVVREYDIRGTRYIVKATYKREGEDAVAKVRRLIRNDIIRMDEKPGD